MVFFARNGYSHFLCMQEARVRMEPTWRMAGMKKQQNRADTMIELCLKSTKILGFFQLYGLINSFYCYSQLEMHFLLLLLTAQGSTDDGHSLPVLIKNLLEHSPAHPLMYCLWQLWSTEWPTSLKCLPLVF